MPDSGTRGEKPEKFVGCCGAYCKTCQAFTEGFCKGCKLGYGRGGRDISKAKCKIKVCCFGKRKLETCADCPDYWNCKILRDFHGKSGYKYKKYKQATDFIRENGYKKFIKAANKWKGAYGRF
ncbi:DUF3795 domain-containing protein [Candidatus Woesearchaeota archaeon]|nr:DUF3795 domain-containing protein [Candidatus Woesearchaeota archaeon]